jgi:hypothetical protein
MKTVAVLSVSMFLFIFTSASAVAQISYCKDILETGNPGG